MVTGISFAIFLLSFVLGVIGGSLHLFLLLTISLTVASLSFILTALTIDKNSKQIKKPFRGRPMTVFRVVMLFLGAGCLLISSLYLMDVPTYVSGDYQKVEGVPSNIKHSKSTRTNPGGGVDVTIQDYTFQLNLDYPMKEIKGQRFTIHFLPHSSWVVDYHIEDLD